MFTWENLHWRKSHTRLPFLFLIAFTWWLAHVISCYFKVHFMLIKYTWFKITNITHAIPVRNKWSFRVYMIPLRDFLPWYNNRGELTPGDLHRHHDVLWWYHVNKFRAMRGNRSELAPAWKAPLVSCKHPLKLGSCSRLMQAVALLEIAYIYFEAYKNDKSIL